MRGLVGALVAGQATALLAVADQLPSADSATWLLLATMVIQFILNEFRENKKRKWEKEDAAEKERLRQLIEAKAANINSNINTNTQVNQDALDAANNFHARLDAVQEKVKPLIEK